MSKQIKQMVIEDLHRSFRDVRDLLVLSATGIDCTTDNQLRLGLRRKNIRLQVVKNSLARKVFDDLGIRLGDVWQGPTVLAWGGSSIADLSKELEAIIKKNNKITVKLAVCDGQPLTFEQALKMPTRVEALGRVIALALSPASRIAGQLRAPGGQVAGQIKTLAERPAAAAG
jgi:large subunit ribosomal protein L10